MATRNTPDPLKPGHIEGQHPATPERMPGHTGYYSDDDRAGSTVDMTGRPAFLYENGQEMGVTLDASSADLPDRPQPWQLREYVSLDAATADLLGIPLDDLVAAVSATGIYVRGSEEAS